MDRKSLPDGMKKGIKKEMKQLSKRSRQDLCAKNRHWIWLGSVTMLVVLIAGLVWILFQFNSTRAARHTFEQLRECLSEMDISRDMTELVIPNERCNDELYVLDMGQFKRLQVLWIGSYSFGRVHSVRLNGLKKLERVVIGDMNFTNSTGELIICNCDALKELRVGRESFKSYDSIVLSDLPLLEVLRMDGESFKEASELKLTGLSSLKRVMMGHDCFVKVSELRLIEMSSLERVVIGDRCFTDCSGSFVVRDCNDLRELHIGRGSFMSFAFFELTGLPLLEVIRMDGESFKEASELKLTGLSSLKKVMMGHDCFSQSNGRCIISQCKALNEVTLGNGSFGEYYSFQLDDLPGLEVLDVGDDCFERTVMWTLEQLSGLKQVSIGERSFSKKNGALLVKNCGQLESFVIRNQSFTSYASFELEGVPLLKSLKVKSNCFRDVTALKLDGLSRLEVFEVGDDCFTNVKELQLIGLNELKSVVIGENSFTKEKNDWGDDSERHFFLKDCEQVKELRVGRYSFSDYSVIEIANVSSLEVIEIGDLNGISYNFYSASLRLRSVIVIW